MISLKFGVAQLQIDPSRTSKLKVNMLNNNNKRILKDKTYASIQLIKPNFSLSNKNVNLCLRHSVSMISISNR